MKRLQWLGISLVVAIIVVLILAGILLACNWLGTHGPAAIDSAIVWFAGLGIWTQGLICGSLFVLGFAVGVYFAGVQSWIDGEELEDG